MTTSPEQPQRTPQVVVPWRELLALAAIFAGTFGLAYAAFSVDWRLGVAEVSTFAIVVGVLLGRAEGE